MLTHAQLLQLLHYDPQTGIWTRRITTRGAKQGSRADRSTRNKAYFRIVIGKRKYLAHVLAWFYVTRSWPQAKLDHKDTNGKNNAFSNLRLATHSQNLANSRIRKDNTSGPKGVSWDKSRKKWFVKITVAQKQIPLGRFACFEAATLAYREAAQKYFGEFARYA